ncbi:MAG: O-methyltransferase [Flavobacteriales bacterium]
MTLLPEEIDQYIQEHCTKQGQLLDELERETWLKIVMPRMISSHVQGRILSLVSHMLHPKKVLEIGTFTGFSALCFSEGLADGGIIDTLEINEELSWIQDKYWEKAGIQSKINRITGPAMDSLKNLDGPYDLIFIDADKEGLVAYYEACLPKLRKGGILMVDNVLWSGKVVETLKKNDRDTRSILALNKHIQDDSRVENVLLGIRDGIMTARKI